MNGTVSNAERDLLIGKYLDTAVGRSKIAATLTQPLRLRRDYKSVARKAFLVENLPDGALPLYDKDPDVAAYVIGEDAENVVSYIKGRRVLIPLFEIAANPEVTLSQVRERRFDVVDRMQALANAQIQAAEDERAFGIMDTVAANGFDSVSAIPDQTLSVVAPITGAILSDAFGLITNWDLTVAHVFMSGKDHADLRKFGRDILDPVTQKELFEMGWLGSIWGAKIIVSRLVQPGTVYVTCEPEFFGRVPVRTELTVLSADDPKRRTIGFSCFEQLGIGCHNPRGLVTLDVTR